MNNSTASIKTQLSNAILMMMAEFYVQNDWGTGDPALLKKLIAVTKIVADGIAIKLMKSLALHQGELTAQDWSRFVGTATKDAFIELPDGSMLKLAENPSYATAVVACTEKLVAPTDSTWAEAIKKTEGERLFAQLKSLHLPLKQINRVMRQWRSGYGQAKSIQSF